MPTKLRVELDFTVLPPVPAKFQQSRRSASPSPLASRKSKMSLTQTYRLASCARNKLGKEAIKGDHDLRLLVGHANLLDSLMLDLANAEREQEAWFNATIRKAAKPAAAKHVQWMDSVAEREEAAADLSDEEYETISEDDADLSDDDDDLLDADDFPVVSMASRQRRAKSPPPSLPEDDDEDLIIDDEADEAHALVRVASNATSSSSSFSSSSSSSTPAMDIDVEDSLPALEYELESDEDSPLPSPAKETVVFFPESKKAQAEPMSGTADLAGLHRAQPAVVLA